MTPTQIEFVKATWRHEDAENMHADHERADRARSHVVEAEPANRGNTTRSAAGGGSRAFNNSEDALKARAAAAAEHWQPARGATQEKASPDFRNVPADRPHAESVP